LASGGAPAGVFFEPVVFHLRAVTLLPFVPEAGKIMDRQLQGNRRHGQIRAAYSGDDSMQASALTDKPSPNEAPQRAVLGPGS
jgi:hypothetical protein